MSDIDIFDAAEKQRGEFFKFEKVGDSIQGTYVDVYEAVDGYGNEQYVYVLKDRDGKLWNVGVKKVSEILVKQMEPVKLGQIIGFKFDKETPSKKVPGKMAKIINVTQFIFF